VLFAIKGKVDDWRIQRWNAWKIVEGFRGSEGMPEIWDFYPLPYDDELMDQDKRDIQNNLRALSTEDFYQSASRELANFNWPQN